MPESIAAEPGAESSPRTACPAPADFAAELAAYDRDAQVGHFAGPRHRITYRVLGDGPPLILLPGVAATYRGYALVLNRLAARFRTILPDYPGESPDDGARLGSIRHLDLVDDVFRLIDHLHIGRAYLFGVSFGSTVTLGALHREPRRFPRAALQGGFAHRRFAPAERLALALGRRVRGTADRLPFRERILTYNAADQFPRVIADRWPLYLADNGRTPIAAMAHRLGLLGSLDLRPTLSEIPVEILLLQGNEDRIVGRRSFDELRLGLPKVQAVVMPLIGHQPHYTHAEVLAQAVGEFLLPCAPGGCPNP